VRSHERDQELSALPVEALVWLRTLIHSESGDAVSSTSNTNPCWSNCSTSCQALPSKPTNPPDER
jgi:hypothetical protein